MKKMHIISLLCMIMAGLSQTLYASIVADDFNNATLNPAWIVETPSPGTIVQLTGDGRLIIRTNTDNNDLWTNHNMNAPRLYQPVNSNDNWMVETKMHFSATSTFQEAGIFVTVTDGVPEWGGYLRLTTAVYPWDTNEYIKFLTINVYGSYDDVYFRLEKNGNQYTSWYSFDGESFIAFGTKTLAYTVTGVGLFALRQDSIGPDPEGTADNNVRSTAYFDYFDVNRTLYPPTPEPPPIPEPLSGILLLSALAGIKTKFRTRRVHQSVR
ncbi:MAG: hypothetical protein RBU23_00785 [Candidatus Auribacterota bacterium]|nr:hypothetical protein [Candidatus Auribacterota bacterium]